MPSDKKQLQKQQAHGKIETPKKALTKKDRNLK